MGIAKATVCALAFLLVLTPMCGAVCRARACNLPASAAGAPCHETAGISEDASRILAPALSCSARELPAALPADFRSQPAKQPLGHPADAAAAADGSEVPAMPVEDLLRRPGPLFRSRLLSSLVLRI
jgi:hypothetical protein